MSRAGFDLRSPADPLLLRRLRRMRAVATGLLAAMAALFVATTWFLPEDPWLSATRAFAEAALIGGLADWFAVTALFKRPLGLPIPHTAIVRTRKNDIGRALARFIGEHFLVREAVERRLDRSNLAARLGVWLKDERNAERLGTSLAGALDWAARSGDASALRSALGRELGVAFDAVPLDTAVATLLELVTSGSRAQALIDQLVAYARGELDKHRVPIRVRIHEQSPWWLPKFVDQEIFDKLMTGIDELLEEIASDPDHPARVAILERLQSLKDSFAGDSASAEKSQELKRAIVEHPVVRGYARDLWARLGEAFRGQLADPSSTLQRSVVGEIRRLGATLGSDDEAASTLNGWIKQVLLYLVENYRDPLTEIVSDTIESWDPVETSRRIELNVGTDLQFIRLNGTLVGGAVGLGIYVVAALAS
jgi:uncharacterized membrane-anchored protein YjiN (DUF445 family)